ncbi:MAG: hypothetical protein KF861_11555, partial [Planctomycetaceae bacterium]|nr:hypothetical protein [Planctomycetaceae bacterium]
MPRPAWTRICMGPSFDDNLTASCDRKATGESVHWCPGLQTEEKTNLMFRILEVATEGPTRSLDD